MKYTKNNSEKINHFPEIEGLETRPLLLAQLKRHEQTLSDSYQDLLFEEYETPLSGLLEVEYLLVISHIETAARAVEVLRQKVLAENL